MQCSGGCRTWHVRAGSRFQKLFEFTHVYGCLPPSHLYGLHLEHRVEAAVASVQLQTKNLWATLSLIFSVERLDLSH